MSNDARAGTSRSARQEVPSPHLRYPRPESLRTREAPTDLDIKFSVVLENPRPEKLGPRGSRPSLRRRRRRRPRVGEAR